MDVTNRELRKIKAQYFVGPSCESGLDFRTTSMLLRAIADWLDENGIQDPEFQSLVVRTSFSGRSDEFGDPFRQTAIVYFIDNPQESKDVKQGEK
jgi:hypothetical protein